MWTGLLIGAGLILVMTKFPIVWKLRMTTYEIRADFLIFAFVNMLHAGSGVSGVVHAAIAAGVVSLYISHLRKQVGFYHGTPPSKRAGMFAYWLGQLGFYERDEYAEGKTNVSSQL